MMLVMFVYDGVTLCDRVERCVLIASWNGECEETHKLV